jgi:type I restriction enzyme M protein
MLDTSTKKRIDDCRDILVGKLPDPKAQIEQITIGLIYKFMDDMDKEAIELGGQAKFFTDYKVSDPEFPNDRTKDKVVEFSKYAWDNLLNAKVTATEMLTLYSEAIVGMDKNPNIPQLFRDIFKNAYLPYRDPETLKLFLKTIAEFEYSHSEKLGDAFEYLLSVMGSQGDAGQFRTPRHIIDFLVAIVDPGKNETILDPACGTAGFLISAFKHIKEKNNNELTPDERKKLIQNFVGYDISPDMVRLSLVNLYLHGFSDPHIYEYDTLSSEERWNENFDVVLANPPFMSPKGGIRPHKKFTISSNRSEVLFVDYIAEHLNPKGKAGIIVPEGVIFQVGTAYKDLRKMLVDNYLYAVVSLPAGVFNPYSGVKTSILLMDKEVAKQRNEILFVKIDNDGYNLGAQRTSIKGSQLDEAIALTHEFAKSGKLNINTIAHTATKIDIAKNGDYNLSGSRYLISAQLETEYENIKLEDVLDYEQPTPYIVATEEYDDSFKTPVLTAGKTFLLGHTNEENGIYQAPLPVIIFDDFTTATKYVDFPFKVKSSAMKILKARENANITFLYYLMQNINFDSSDHKRYWISQYSKIEIPLPSLPIQEEIVAEIKSYQKIIDGAKAIVESYKPSFEIDSNWDIVQLGVHCKIKGGNAFKSSDYVDDGIQLIRMGNVKQMFFDVENSPSYLPKSYESNYPNYLLEKGDLLVSMTGTVGKEDYGNVCQIDIDENYLLNQRVGKFEIQTNQLDREFLYYVAQTDNFRKQLFANSSGGVRQSNISNKGIESIMIPLPAIKIQQQIVAQIQTELDLVNGNKQLIEIFQERIKNRIAKVWGE